MLYEKLNNNNKNIIVCVGMNISVEIPEKIVVAIDDNDDGLHIKGMISLFYELVQIPSPAGSPPGTLYFEGKFIEEIIS